MNVDVRSVAMSHKKSISACVECNTSLWIKQAIIQLIVLILFRRSGVLSVYISRAILITQEVHATKHYAYFNSYIAFRTRGLSTDYQLTTSSLHRMSGLINIKVRLLRERVGEQWGVNYATPLLCNSGSFTVTKKLTHWLQNSQLHVCDEQKMSDKRVWNSLKVHKGLSSSL